MFGQRLLVALLVLALSFGDRLAGQITVIIEPPVAGFNNANTSGLTVFWVIRNQNSFSVTIWTSCTFVDRVTSCSVPPNVVIGPNSSAQVTVTFSTGSAGVGRVNLDAHTTTCPPNACLTYNGGTNRTVQATVAPTSSSISINPAPHNGDYRGVTKCGADCFDATVGYATPAYFSMDTPRSVTLLYRSSQATPMGFVQVDATDNTSPAPDKMSIRLKRPDGTWVTFTNGSDEIFYWSGAGTSRLAAQFDAAALATGAHDYTVVARSWRGTGFQEATYPIRILVVNETGSPFGAGWSIPGFQKLSVRNDASVVITEGDGSIAFFKIDLCPSYCTFTSPPGDFTTLTTQFTWPNFGGYIRKYPDGSYVTLTSSGLMTSVRDRFGNQTSYAYDASNRLSTITDPASKVITFGYGGDGKLDWVKDPGNRQTFVTINGALDVTEIKDPSNVSALRPSYGVEHRMTQRLDRRGSPWGFSYDFAGKIAADTMPTITADGQSVRPVTRFSSIERAVLVDPASGLGTSTSPAPRVLPATVRAATTNPRGFATQYTLDRFGAATRVDEPLGRITKLARNTHSQVTADTAPSGHRVEYTWVGANLTKVVDRSTGRTVNIDYESTFNEILKIYGDVDTLVNTWSAGKLTSTRRANRPATTFTHDSRGRVLTQTDPAGHVTNFYYAPSGWQNTDSVKASGRRTAFTYDIYGRRSSVKDPLNFVTTFEYDSLNRPMRTIGPVADTTRFEHDSLFLRAVTDAIGQRYVYSRNALGWLEVQTDPAQRQTVYRYDANGNLKQLVNRRTQTVAYTYDALDNLTSRTADGATTTYSVHPADTLLAAANGESTDTVRFDVAGRPAVEITVFGGTRYERKTSYNVRDLPTALEMIAPWRDTISYRYNANMLLDTLIDLKGDRTTLVYNAELLLESTLLPPPTLTISHGSHSTHLPSQITYPNDAAVNALMGLVFDIDNRAIVWKRKKVAGDTTWTFEPDELGRIKRYTTLGVDSTFTYDKVGNRTDLGAVREAGNRLRAFNGYALDYDNDGNLSRKFKSGVIDQTLVWNSLGELVSATTNGVTTTFGYDGIGRRVRKTTGAATVRYVWDDDDLLAEIDGSGNRVAEYTYYPGVDRPHSVRRGGANGTVYYFAQDFPGSVIGVFNTSGSLVWQNRYSTFGTSLSGFPRGAEPTEQWLRFAGRQLDSETGLYQVRARYYDAQVGRFISEDPIGLEGGINPYVYADNNPVNGRDPSGLDDCERRGRFTDPSTWYWECPPVVVEASGGGEITRNSMSLRAAKERQKAWACINKGGSWNDISGVCSKRARATESLPLAPPSGHTFFVKSAALMSCPLTARFSQQWMRTLWWGGDARYVEGDVNIRRQTAPSARIGGWAWYAGTVRAVQSESWGIAVLFDGPVMGEISCRSGAGTLTGFQLVVDAIP